MAETETALVAYEPSTSPGDVLAQAQALTISGEETAELAIELRDGIKALLAEIEGAYRPHIQRAHQLHAGLCAELRERGAVPRTALDLVNEKIGAYELRRRQAEEAERRRIAEQQAREAAERREAEARAAALISPEQAEDVRAMPLDHFAEPAPAQVTTPTKARGVSVTPKYVAELTDLVELVTFAVKHPAMLALLVAPNQAGLDSLVKQQGEKFAIPGVKRVLAGTTVRSTKR